VWIIACVCKRLPKLIHATLLPSFLLRAGSAFPPHSPASRSALSTYSLRLERFNYHPQVRRENRTFLPEQTRSLRAIVRHAAFESDARAYTKYRSTVSPLQYRGSTDVLLYMKVANYCIIFLTDRVRICTRNKHGVRGHRPSSGGLGTYHAPRPSFL
jgi:hypothetical protein